MGSSIEIMMPSPALLIPWLFSVVSPPTPQKKKNKQAWPNHFLFLFIIFVCHPSLECKLCKDRDLFVSVIYLKTRYQTWYLVRAQLFV